MASYKDSSPPTNVFVYSSNTKKNDIPANVTHVKVDSSVKEIYHRSAFGENQSLIAIEFSEGLERIGRCAFHLCRNLETVKNFPSTLLYIEESAFSRCPKLETMDDFPKGLLVIGRGAFFECLKLKEIKIPSPHVLIKPRAFYRCESLTSVEIPQGLAEIGDGWFRECTSLQYIQIPSSVVKIGAAAFAGCLELRTIRLPGHLSTIETKTFHGCEALTHVTIPSSVTRIESAAFAYCTSLVSLELPENLKLFQLNETFSPDDSESDEESDEPDPLNIAGCYSLVNFVLPLEQHVQHYAYEFFMDGLKLKTIVANYGDLVSKMKHRFDALPLHRLCYYHSYHHLIDVLQQAQQIMEENPSAGAEEDAFGMTPLHILALSQTPNLSLFQTLMKKSSNKKVDIIRRKDKYGLTPIDYFCLNHEATAVIRALLSDRLRWLGLRRWKSDVLSALGAALTVKAGELRQEEIRLLCCKLATYERLEAISILELATWKAKIDEVNTVSTRGHQKRDEESGSKIPRLTPTKLQLLDRQSCRTCCGADIVISNILPFLDKDCLKN